MCIYLDMPQNHTFCDMKKCLPTTNQFLNILESDSYGILASFLALFLVHVSGHLYMGVDEDV